MSNLEEKLREIQSKFALNCMNANSSAEIALSPSVAQIIQAFKDEYDLIPREKTNEQLQD